MEIQQSRREFIFATSALVAGAVIAPKTSIGSLSVQTKSRPICVFAKCLQFLDYNQLAERAAKIGFDGVDLPVRKKGYILPENVSAELPKLIRILKSAGISVPTMVTGIKDADDPETERILGAASEAGVKHYRMGYLRYDSKKSIQENLDHHKRTMEKLAVLNRKFNIHGEYQNHSGKIVGAAIWDLHWILKDTDPADIGIQYDIRHAVCEASNSWPIGMELLAPWIGTVDIKDFLWYKDKEKWRAKNVPLGEGMIDYDAYLKEYNRLKLNGPISMHYEYDLGGAEHGNKETTMDPEKIYAYLKQDLTWFKRKLSEHKIA